MDQARCVEQRFEIREGEALNISTFCHRFEKVSFNEINELLRATRLREQERRNPFKLTPATPLTEFISEFYVVGKRL